MGAARYTCQEFVALGRWPPEPKADSGVRSNSSSRRCDKLSMDPPRSNANLCSGEIASLKNFRLFKVECACHKLFVDPPMRSSWLLFDNIGEKREKSFRCVPSCAPSCRVFGLHRARFPAGRRIRFCARRATSAKYLRTGSSTLSAPNNPTNAVALCFVGKPPNPPRISPPERQLLPFVCGNNDDFRRHCVLGGNLFQLTAPQAASNFHI